VLSNNRKFRVPAGELERVVVEQLSRLLLREDVIPCDGSTVQLGENRAGLRMLAEQLEQGSMQERRHWLLAHEAAVELKFGKIGISVVVPLIEAEQPLRLGIDVKARFVDRGSDLRLMSAPDGGQDQRKPDAVLLKLLTHAFAARDALVSGKPDPLTSDYSSLHRNRLARLSYLAPDIVSAIIEGRQPPSLSGRRLLRAADLPFDWQGQRALLGFA
jgi:hypothetical protein